MSPRTDTPPPTDRSMWRSLLRLTHPDGAGSHDLFIWTSSVREHVCGDSFAAEDVRSRYDRRRPPPHPRSPGAGDRVPFGADAGPGFIWDFGRLTARAVGMAAVVEEPHKSLLRMLGDCRELHDVASVRQQGEGASYKSLAYVGHLCGMNSAERARWYEIAASIPLSQRHAGHLIRRLKREAA